MVATQDQGLRQLKRRKLVNFCVSVLGTTL
jgi:hypothetical protein